MITKPTTDTDSPLRVAILDCDFVPPVLVERYPRYSSMFTTRLSEAVSKSARKVEFSAWYVVDGHYPDPGCVDAIIIGGGKASAYDPDPWISRLLSYIADVYRTHPRVKLFGACLGHQLIARALLSDYGVVVQKNPRGLQLGIRRVELDQRFRSAFPALRAHHAGLSDLRVQVVHGDHVFCPPGALLPPGWMTIGSSECCVVHGFWEPGRLLTFQGHFEFDRDITYDLIKVVLARDPTITPEALQAALDGAEGGDDAAVAADMIMSFFLEDGVETELDRGVRKLVPIQSVQEVRAFTV